MWELVGRIGGQLRTSTGGVTGFDMAAALAVATALGIDGAAVATFLPEIEAVMVRELNKERE